VALVKTGGKTVSEVVKELNLDESTLRLWLKKDAPTAPGSITTAEREELIALRKRIKRVEMERDILKKATAFFAAQSG
jgi:transposase